VLASRLSQLVLVASYETFDFVLLSVGIVILDGEDSPASSPLDVRQVDTADSVDTEANAEVSDAPQCSVAFLLISGSVGDTDPVGDVFAVWLSWAVEAALDSLVAFGTSFNLALEDAQFVLFSFRQYSQIRDIVYVEVEKTHLDSPFLGVMLLLYFVRSGLDRPCLG